MTAEWMDRAACRAADPEVMQPEYARRADVAETIARFCDHCPLRRECTELAESQGPGGAYGIHGGKWWGPPLREVQACSWCGGRMPTPQPTGRPGLYCGGTCRVAALRARQAVSA